MFNSQRAAGGVIAVFDQTWNGLGKVGAKSSFCRMTQVMPNGISTRYQGKAHDGACREWMCSDTSN